MTHATKLHYITSMDFPISYATGVQVLGMCRAFSKINRLDFRIILSSDRNNMFEDIKTIENNSFKLSKFKLRSPYNFLWLLIYIINLPKEKNVLYFKDLKLATMCILIKKILHRPDIIIAVECHLLDDSKYEKKVFNEANNIFCITSHIIRMAEEKYPDSIPKIHYAPDGVDLKIFSTDFSKNDALNKYNLPIGKFLIGYFGNFSTVGIKKGVDTAIDAMNFLSSDNHLVLVGGVDKDLNYYKKYVFDNGLADKITFLGRLEHEKIPDIMRSMDCLVSPMPYNDFNAYFTSPLKLFEYMASGIPMIYSDLPSVRDILDETMTSFCIPGDARSLAEKVEKIKNDYKKSKDKAYKASLEVKQKYTWDKRAENIISILNR
ncbi:MAG: glycosyltransferase family 4 protein [Patescibacteria group bacterium]|nr:glycosyltransferase family 4 protein [Patescibacteria group bacterium]